MNIRSEIVLRLTYYFFETISLSKKWFEFIVTSVLDLNSKTGFELYLDSKRILLKIYVYINDYLSACSAGEKHLNRLPQFATNISTSPL